MGQLDRRRWRAVPPVLPQGAARARRPSTPAHRGQDRSCASADLTHWEVHRDALAPAEGRWDDLALWTGSVARGDDGVWRLYYSGLSTSRGLGVLDQRIGMAESDDLFAWRRFGEQPLVGPDPRWYVTLDEDPEASGTWRDPFVFKDPGGDGWHMLITARAAGAPRFRDGVLGHARSADMLAWELGRRSRSRGPGSASSRSPRSGSSTGSRCSCSPATPISRAPTSERGSGRLHVVGPRRIAHGPWELDLARPFRGEPMLTAAPLVQRRDGTWALLGFRNLEPARGAAGGPRPDPGGAPRRRADRPQVASWKITPSAVRRPRVTVATPWRMPIR